MRGACGPACLPPSLACLLCLGACSALLAHPPDQLTSCSAVLLRLRLPPLPALPACPAEVMEVGHLGASGFSLRTRCSSEGVPFSTCFANHVQWVATPAGTHSCRLLVTGAGCWWLGGAGWRAGLRALYLLVRCGAARCMHDVCTQCPFSSVLLSALQGSASSTAQCGAPSRGRSRGRASRCALVSQSGWCSSGGGSGGISRGRALPCQVHAQWHHLDCPRLPSCMAEP